MKMYNVVIGQVIEDGIVKKATPEHIRWLGNSANRCVFEDKHGNKCIIWVPSINEVARGFFDSFRIAMNKLELVIDERE
jgi:hypothetical protein